MIKSIEIKKFEDIPKNITHIETFEFCLARVYFIIKATSKEKSKVIEYHLKISHKVYSENKWLKEWLERVILKVLKCTREEYHRGEFFARDRWKTTSYNKTRYLLGGAK